jgi:hypothetical protein
MSLINVIFEMSSFSEHIRIFEDEFSVAFAESLSAIKIEELLSCFRLNQHNSGDDDSSRTRLVDEALNLVLIESDLSTSSLPQQRRSTYAAVVSERPRYPVGTLGNALPCPQKNAKRRYVPSQMKSPPDANTIDKTSLQSRVGTLLELITDEAQLASFNQLKDIYSGFFEDWFILDVLMKYNFDMEASVWSLHESSGPASVSYANAAAGIGSAAHLKPTPDAVSRSEPLLAFKLPPRPSAEQATSVDLIQATTWDYLFGWSRSTRDSEALREVLLRNNPHISLEIDSRTGQLLFVGFRPAQNERNPKGRNNPASQKSSAARDHIVKIDLHGASVKVALEIVRSTICFFVTNGLKYTLTAETNGATTTPNAQVVFVVGKGMHSKCGVPVLFLAITRFLCRRNISYSLSEDNAEITIRLKWNQILRQYLPI